MTKTKTVLVAGLLATVGCGSGGSSTHDYSAVSACLDERAIGAGFSPSSDPDDFDLIAEKAGVGAIALIGQRQNIQVVVERTGSDAERTAKAYELFASGEASDHLKVMGNVVAAYTKTPTDEERELVERCVEDPSGS